MIRIICGVPGAGKTALMTSFALPHLLGAQAHRDLLRCKKLIVPYNEGGFNYTVPSNHLVFADYTILTGANARIKSYECDGYHLGLATNNTLKDGSVYGTMFLPPASYIFLDEAQKYFYSRNTNLSDFVSRFYELHRHYRLEITMTVQRPKLIDLNVRELAAEVIYIEKLEHKKTGNRIERSEWTCRCWDNVAAAIEYIESGFKSKTGQKVKYIYSGNIFRHYESFAFFPAFLAGNEDGDFDIRESVISGTTRDEVDDFNAQHDYKVPEGYYKKKNGA